MTYTTAEGHTRILDALARAIERIGVAVAALGEAYELLDEQTADRLEDELFKPLQAAYGRAQRTYGEFAQRHHLPTQTFAPGPPGAPAIGVRGFIDHAAQEATAADEGLAELQDSMLPVEVGDEELRAGLATVRELLGDVRAGARSLVRTLGR